MKNPFALASRSLRATVRQVNPRDVAKVIPVEKWRSRGAVGLARWLLGKVLVRERGGTREEWVIVETEAYVGKSDRACHASRGRTARTEVMFRQGGIWYVYLCYGVHEMLNLVVGPAEFPAAILIRGVEGAIGPGRVTKALGINRRWNGAAVAPGSGLHVEDHGIVVPRAAVVRGPRVGIDYAGPVWAAKPWRFRVDPGALHRPVS